MTRFLHSRYFVALAILIVGVCAWLYWLEGPLCPAGTGGIVKSWSAPWHIFPPISLGLGLAANFLIAVIIAYLNKTFNVLRSMTMLQGSFFLFLQLGIPVTLTSLYPGSLLALIVTFCCMLMFASFGRAEENQRSVFLTFFLLSGCSSFDASFAVFIPIFVLACAQMRILNLRSILAALMGLSTPWIILFGFGIVSTSDLQMPNVYDFSALRSTTPISGLIGVVTFTIFIGLASWVQNIMKFLSYNAQSRAMLSMLTIILLLCIIAIIVDFANVFSFIPLLNCMVALQLGHLFGAIYRNRRSYIPILTLILIYIGIFAWRLLI